MPALISIALVWLLSLSNLLAAEVNYKQVLVIPETNRILVRLPLTDVTGKVRVKADLRDGLGTPVAPSQTILNDKHYLEWQIGYDTPDTNSPSLVPQIQFIRKGEIKIGHELSKLIYESVRMHLLSTNDLARELAALKNIAPEDFEENQPVELEAVTNSSSAGFQRAVQRIPQFTKFTPHGWVQIQLKQKQRAVGYQAMVYVCLPVNEVLTMDGTPRQPAKAGSKETVFYPFNANNAAFLIDVAHAFGLASQQHNEDIQKILGTILENASNTQK